MPEQVHLTLILCLNYVLNSLENLGNLWLNNDLETKQKLQKLIFPSGLIYEETGFRTGSNPWFDIKKGAFMAPIFLYGTPKGIRIPVYTVKGCCPRPLDDGGLDYFLSEKTNNPIISFNLFNCF